MTALTVAVHTLYVTQTPKQDSILNEMDWLKYKYILWLFNLKSEKEGLDRKRNKRIKFTVTCGELVLL